MSEINKVTVIGNTGLASKITDIFAKGGFQTGEPPDLIIEAMQNGAESGGNALFKAAQEAPLAILATASREAVTATGARTGRPRDTLGLYFTFNLFEAKTLAQIVKGLETSGETVEICRHALEKAGVVAVVVEEVAGLIVDRVMASVVNEAAFMLETKLASQDDINRIPKVCLNWPVGPFEFADLIGIDNIVNTLDAASKESTHFIPCRLLREMVAGGRLGKKTGRGFYEYK